MSADIILSMNRRWSTICTAMDVASNSRSTTSRKGTGNARSERSLNSLCQLDTHQQQGQRTRQKFWQIYCRKPCPCRSLAHNYPRAYPYVLTLLRPKAIVEPLFAVSWRGFMRLRIADDVVVRDLAGESVLLNLSTGTYFGLDAVGTRLWHLIAEHGATTLVLKILLTEYKVDATRLQKALDALIEQLLAKGLLTTDAEHTSTAR